jgi:hypothetical protein
MHKCIELSIYVSMLVCSTESCVKWKDYQVPCDSLCAGSIVYIILVPIYNAA